MKKSIAILLVLAAIMVILSGCGSKSSEDLIGVWNGSWEYEGSAINATVLLLPTGNYYKTTYKNGNLSSKEAGTYELKGSKVCLYEDGNKGKLTEYKYNGSTLKNNGHSISKIAAGSTSSGESGLWSGTWQFEGKGINAVILFGANSDYIKAVYADGKLSSAETGTYEIKGNKLILYLNGSKGNITEYDYNGSSLKNNGHIMTKIG